MPNVRNRIRLSCLVVGIYGVLAVVVGWLKPPNAPEPSFFDEENYIRAAFRLGLLVAFCCLIYIGWPEDKSG